MLTYNQDVYPGGDELQVCTDTKNQVILALLNFFKKKKRHGINGLNLLCNQQHSSSSELSHRYKINDCPLQKKAAFGILRLGGRHTFTLRVLRRCNLCIHFVNLETNEKNGKLPTNKAVTG